MIGVNDDFLKPFRQAVANRLLRQQEDEFAHFFITPLVCHCPSLSRSEAGALAVRLACGSVHAAAPLLGPDARPGTCEVLRLASAVTCEVATLARLPGTTRQGGYKA